MLQGSLKLQPPWFAPEFVKLNYEQFNLLSLLTTTHIILTEMVDILYGSNQAHLYLRNVDILMEGDGVNEPHSTGLLSQALQIL